MRPERVLGYARVSSREQSQGTSLEAQQSEIERYCADRSLSLTRVFIDVESGSGEASDDRTAQRELMALVTAGDLVLVAKQDRWSRDVVHYLTSADEIRQRGARLTSIAEGLDVESPERRLAATQFASFAEYERLRIRERTLGGRRHLRARGLHVEGHAPIGFRIEARRLVATEQADLVRSMFALCLDGESTRSIATQMQESIAGIDHATVARCLTDPRYAGLTSTIPFRRRGRTVIVESALVATHDPIVDRATWDRAQVALRERRFAGRSPEVVSGTTEFLLRGIVRCSSCDHVMGSMVSGISGSARQRRPSGPESLATTVQLRRWRSGRKNWRAGDEICSQRGQ